ncbi:MAG: hypothetical protein WCP45_14780 [Verrucomicrobiota bacterium]
MRKITAREFKQSIKRDPAWALTLTDPVEITDYCDMDGSKITHLSALLHFSGRNNIGNAATFEGCKHLKVAEGKFAGLVDFSTSGVEKIGRLEITAPNKEGGAACFWRCYALNMAEGTYPGGVWFDESGVRTIGELFVTAPDHDGFAAGFFGCKSLDIAEGTFAGTVDFEQSGIKKIGKLAITVPYEDGIKACFYGCHVRLPAEFLGREYEMLEATRRKNLDRIAAGKAAAKALKAAPNIEI